MIKFKRKSILLTVVVIAVVLACSLVLFVAGKSDNAPAKGKPTLSILCFQGYAEPAWVEPFEKKYNCDVNVTYAGTVEEHFTKTKAAPDEYNLVSNDSGR